MDKIKKIFADCQQENRAALIIFCSCGYPDMERSELAIEAAIRAGADIIELGVPFSDPMADGAVIRKASEIALQNGADLKKILLMAERIAKRHPKTGFILFSYLNILYNYGLDKLCRKLKEIQMDGILAVDLPLEEFAELLRPCQDNGLHLIPLVSPATPLQRARKIMAQASGFVYSVNVCGVTGVRDLLPDEIVEHLAELKKNSPVPIAAGFGITDAAAAHRLGQVADGVIVGSAFIKILSGDGDFSLRISDAEQFIQELAQKVRHQA
ncbi:MAG: tryptophan synthase subunit alpha [Lentisphaeria bacterium]